jgi:hypothetical protein
MEPLPGAAEPLRVAPLTFDGVDPSEIVLTALADDDTVSEVLIFVSVAKPQQFV